MKSTRWNVLAVVAVLLGFGLRLFALGKQSLWYDEAFSLVISGINWPVFWMALLSDGVHPPGYYLLLRGWLLFFGQSEVALRLPSVIAGTLSIPLIYQLGTRLHSRRLGLAAAVLLAVNPFALWYAQEGRMYSLLLFLTLGSGTAFWQLAKRPTWKRWWALVLFSAAGFLLHYFTFIFSLVQFLFLMLLLRRMHRVLRWWVAAQAVAVLPFLPWAWAILRREGGSFGIGWIPPISALDIPLTLTNLTFSFGNPGRWLTWPALVLIIAAIVLSAIAIRKSTGNTPPFYRFLLLWLLFPPVFVWLVSLRLPLYVDRHLIIILPALLLLISAVALARTRPAQGMLVLILLVSIAAASRLWLDPTLTKEDWRAVAAIVQAAEQPNDALIMRNLQISLPFNYYYRGNLKPDIAAINRQNFSLEEMTAGHDRVWIVFRRPFEPTHALAGSNPYTWRDEPVAEIRQWLAAHEAELAEEKNLPGIHWVLYELAGE